MTNLSKGHYILLAELVIILILILLCINGCNKRQTYLKEISTLSNERQRVKDSIDAVVDASIQSKKEYTDSLAVANALLSIKQNQIDATSCELDAANIRIRNLINKHQSIAFPVDTSATLVPAQFLTDCKDCFFELEGQNNLVNKYRKEVAEKDSFEEKITVIYNTRINQLEYTNEQLVKLASKSDSISAAVIRKAKLRGKVLLSLSTIAIDRYYPSGVGAGLLYQDKHNRQFGLKAFGTDIGPIYTAELNLPLSFRRK